MPTKKRRPTARAKKKVKPGRPARKAKAPSGAKRAPARKHASVTRKAKAAARPSAKTRKPAAAAAAKAAPTSRSPVLDEVLEEPVLDVSTILRVKDRVARTRRDVDEDELQQFSDPSLVVEVQTRDIVSVQDEDSAELASDLPDLFAAEARRQAARTRDAGAAGAAPDRRGSSLFGPLGAPKDEPPAEVDVDLDLDSEERDED